MSTQQTAQQTAQQAIDLARDAICGSELTAAQSRALFTGIAQGELPGTVLAGLLTALAARGETPELVSGAAAAFVAQAVAFPEGESGFDSCGTGGDRAGTINISTAAALVAATAGVPMLKHGNRSVSSRSGSADVLDSLGIATNLGPEAARQLCDETGFAFLFAPRYHPAIARVMPVRRELAVPTVFNLLGPLLNPAPLRAQLIGVADPRRGELIANALRQIGRERALVVHGEGLDEIALHGETDVWELREGKVEHYRLTPEELGLSRYPLEQLRGGDADANARDLRALLAGNGQPAHAAAVCANAGAVFYLAGLSDSIADGVAKAREIVASGKGAAHLEKIASRSAQLLAQEAAA
ncbi:anthranilate phosphoribosyltransferase [Dermabacteraceae bacterium P9123]